ncbi:efflux RND transporter permease subunit [Candidatus Fokinia crypta]|uniref:MdtC-like MFS transporter n=1 Tax=Candidatus Fokinia crypta TaxID=1920990 RepID=A0ABZ0UNU3_9RICK|nr:efflux RND transporter permease subunit [Candidatus Fokinia cryptica]WPX97796.1 MdtC-like MFS transporter [Candidatus Fokinia cryptica]
MLDFFTQHKRTTIVLLLFSIFIGYLSYLKIPKENNPDVKIPVIYMLVMQQGISPEDSEQLIVKPLETALRGISGIKHITSHAYEGSASIILEFNSNIDQDKALEDVRNKVDDTKNQLPKDADTPVIQQVDLSLFPVLNVILSGDLDQRTLISIGREMKNQIKMIPEVLEVDLSGDREPLVEILVNPSKLALYNLNPSVVADFISKNNMLITAGKIDNAGGAYQIKIKNLIESYQELLDFPIANYNGAVLKIRDIGDVKYSFKDSTTIARINGEQVIALAVSKRNGANIINTLEKIKNLVESRKQYLPKNLHITYSNDEANEIKETLSDLENGILLAGLLVLLIVFSTMGIGSSLLVAFSLPASFFATILILYVCGYTLNIIVLFSLILSIGMVVDDAIVVSEYADRKITEGEEPSKAFLSAAKRMLWPIITSTLVKVIVFLPLLFWPGMVGNFMKYMPITVTMILTCSLLFALFFQPSVGAILIKKPRTIDSRKVDEIYASENGDLSELQGVYKVYYNILIKLTSRPKKSILLLFCGIICIYVVFGFFSKGFEFFPDIEPKNSLLVIRSSGNLSMKQRDTITREVESQIMDFKEIKHFYTKIIADARSQSLKDDTIATIDMEYVDWKIRRKAKDIQEDIKKAVKNVEGIKFEILSGDSGPKSGKPVWFSVRGDDWSSIKRVTEHVVMLMKKDDNFINVETSEPSEGLEYRINVNRILAAKYNITAANVGQIVQMATGGLLVSKYITKDYDNEIDIVVRFPEEYRNIDWIKNVRIPYGKGSVPLECLAETKATRKRSEILHVDCARAITIQSDVKDGVVPEKQIELIQRWFSELEEQKVSMIVHGDLESQKESGNFLGNAFLSAIVMMFIVMLTQFNSFYNALVVMSSVVLSTGGVLLGLMLSNQAFGVVMCGIGIIALSGIVLNNNIILIDTYQYLRKLGHTVEDAAIRAAVQRFRPITLTASTAILGLLPLVLGLTINLIDREILYDAPSSQWWKQLSASIAGGLTFATILTLFFTPCMILLGKRFEKEETVVVKEGLE